MTGSRATAVMLVTAKTMANVIQGFPSDFFGTGIIVVFDPTAGIFEPLIAGNIDVFDAANNPDLVAGKIPVKEALALLTAGKTDVFDGLILPPMLFTN